jgi:hypothetical protein
MVGMKEPLAQAAGDQLLSRLACTYEWGYKTGQQVSAAHTIKR